MRGCFRGGQFPWVTGGSADEPHDQAQSSVQLTATAFCSLTAVLHQPGHLLPTPQLPSKKKKKKYPQILGACNNNDDETIQPEQNPQLLLGYGVNLHSISDKESHQHHTQPCETLGLRSAFDCTHTGEVKDAFYFHLGE